VISEDRSLCRLELEIVKVRCERLHAITAEDVAAEGATGRETFESIWTKLNGCRGYPWEMNPWVYAIEFKATPATRAVSR